MKNNIKALREVAGFTQAALADRAGVSVPQVSKWEAGRVDIPASRLAQIADILGTTPSQILSSTFIHPHISTVQPLTAADIERSKAAGLLPQDYQPPKAYANGSVVKMEGPSAQRMLENLPVYGTALGAAREVNDEAVEQVNLNQADVVQYVKRPVMLEGNATAYGLYVAGFSMEPRHMDGDLLIVDPKGRVRVGEDVVVYLRPANPEEDNGQAARAVLVKRLLRRTSGYIELEQFQPAKVFRVDAAEVVRIDRVVPWQELLN